MSFLAKAKGGLGSHVREATILEEQANIAHTVGLKHTILFPLGISTIVCKKNNNAHHFSSHFALKREQ